MSDYVTVPGLCRIWARLRSQPFWTDTHYPARGFTDCVRLIEDFQDRFPGLYDYEITADLDACRPTSVAVSV